MQGLAQSNNNARLNYSAKHVIKAAGNKVQKLSKGMGAKEKHKREEQGAAGAHTWASCVMRPNEVTSFLVPFFFLHFCFFFRRNSQTDYMNKGIQMSKLPHTLFRKGRGIPVTKLCMVGLPKRPKLCQLKSIRIRQTF